MLSKIKQILRILCGKDLYVRANYSCPQERFGSLYGGCVVAVEAMNSGSIVYSFGIGSDASFDKALIDRFGLTVHGFDPTPESIRWVKNEALPDSFIFHEYGIADFDGEVSFNPSENPEYISHTILERPQTKDRSITVPVKRLSTIMQELGHNHIDLLKMDIEGAEYAVIADMEKSRIYPGQIFVEFHHRFDGVGITKTKDVLSRLKKLGYALFFVAKNNREFAFLRTTE